MLSYLSKYQLHMPVNEINGFPIVFQVALKYKKNEKMPVRDWDIKVLRPKIFLKDVCFSYFPN
jgi:hypothetical protein